MRKIKILNTFFYVNQYTEFSHMDWFGFYGIYILLDKNFNCLYIGMSTTCIGTRLATHKRNGIDYIYFLVHEPLFIDFNNYLKSELDKEFNKKLINMEGYCKVSDRITKYKLRKTLLNLEKFFIKSLKPKNNIIHNG